MGGNRAFNGPRVRSQQICLASERACACARVRLCVANDGRCAR